MHIITSWGEVLEHPEKLTTEDRLERIECRLEMLHDLIRQMVCGDLMDLLDTEEDEEFNVPL